MLFMKKTRYFSFLLVITILSSCASGNLSKNQRNALTALKVPAGRTEAKAYSDPQSMTMESAETLGTLSGLGFGLVGGLVAATGAAIKQQSFESKNKNVLGTLRSGTPSDLGTMVSRELEAQLSTDAFYGPRLKAAGNSAQLRVTVMSMTLVKVPGNRGHSPGLVAKAELVDASGKKMITRIVMADGYGHNKSASVTNAVAPMATYASNLGLLREHYSQVAAAAARHLASEFRKAAGQK
jgi:hypothetical protein